MATMYPASGHQSGGRGRASGSLPSRRGQSICAHPAFPDNETHIYSLFKASEINKDLLMQ